MELDDLATQGTFIDFSWQSFEDEGPLTLEAAFALFSHPSRFAATDTAPPLGLQMAMATEKRDVTAD